MHATLTPGNLGYVGLFMEALSCLRCAPVPNDPSTRLNPGRVTLDDVARLSGVSRAAASRALNGRPGVADDVRRRVVEVAAAHGFRPNRAARNLASGMSSVIGLVLPTADLKVDPYGAAITQAVGRATASHDLGLMLHLAADEPGQTVHHILRDGLIDGLLISAVAVGMSWVDELFDSALPTVLVGTHPVRADVVSVDVENLESSAAAVVHLFEQGCERVGCITGRLDRADARDRVAGYRLAHTRAGRAVPTELIAEGNFTRQSGARLVGGLVDAGADGIFVSNDEMAVGAMWTLANRGVRIPDQVMLVGFDGTALDEFHEPSLTTVAQPFDEIGREAVERLLGLVRGQPVESIAIAPTLVAGGSTARSGVRPPM